MSRTPLEQLVDDPWTQERLDEALAPYVGVVPKATLEWIRSQLAETLANDPHASLVLRRAHPRAVEESGQVGWTAPEEEAAPTRRKGEVG